MWHVRGNGEAQAGSEVWNMKRQFVQPRSRWKDTIKTDIRVAGWENVDWIDLVHDWYK
jgi:hypothetical protein